MMLPSRIFVLNLSVNEFKHETNSGTVYLAGFWEKPIV